MFGVDKLELYGLFMSSQTLDGLGKALPSQFVFNLPDVNFGGSCHATDWIFDINTCQINYIKFAYIFHFRSILFS